MLVMCPGITNSFMFAAPLVRRVQGRQPSLKGGGTRIMPTQEQPWLHKPRSEVVLNHKELNSFPEITTKLKIAEDLAKSVGKRKRSIHNIVRNVWKKSPKKQENFIRTLDHQISRLTVECDNRKAQGKSLHKAQHRERTTCYRELSTAYLWQNFPEEDLKKWLENRQAPDSIPKHFFRHCDGKFLSQFLEINREDWMKFRKNLNALRFFPLLIEALKQGPQDPSSRQTGDLPTPSYHGLGLLATAASNAQLLQAMDPRQESDVPDSDNDGRGASESLCSSDGYDDPGRKGSPEQRLGGAPAPIGIRLLRPQQG